ncbi:Conserved hypothetical protein CHP01589, plant [Plasmopara halstedii]|uniref:Uncharacterized protein n=1 Tax=Plasmopara halstedii TaxID=4781 RepID=A0A0N7L8I2_PLAHL|nr:Conserved hypothetical protein CHP01589, plant [Plasmopara halstedii]CEG49947.1 Conserved hypothetical protein CHP01589, plant [Plasmopara halstedii]|eukprot:XP_024586316.1 Conserved hypothetical protein CHP01589, plant [Plasmopara halstedii]
MESLYARDTPTAHERKLKLMGRDCVIEDNQVMLKPDSGQHSSDTLENIMETSTGASMHADGESFVESAANSINETFGLNYSSSPRDLEDRWQTHRVDGKEVPIDKKTEERRLAELSKDLIPTSEILEMKKKNLEVQHAMQHEQGSVVSSAISEVTQQTRRSGVASVPRKARPAITIITGSGSTGLGAKRPPPTPVSPPIFTWNDILRVQNLIERCLQQYLSKNDILVTLKEQANVDPSFTNVVWQKLEEQNPVFFRAYTLQLQLKEQIIAFNYLVGQQKELIANGGKRLLHYSNANQTSATIASTTCLIATTPTLPPISMDARTFLRTPMCSSKRSKQNMYSVASPIVCLRSTSAGMTTLTPPSPLPLPSPIKTDLDTHAFFT